MRASSPVAERAPAPRPPRAIASGGEGSGVGGQSPTRTQNQNCAPTPVRNRKRLRTDPPRASRGRVSSIALRALHPILHPRVGFDAGRRVHAFGGVALDVDELGLLRLLVE